MKRAHLFILSFIMTFCMTGCAGLKPIPQSDKTFSKVIEAQGFTKDQIFDSSKAWVEANLWEAKDTIESQDKSAGTIIANGIISYPDPYGFHTMAGYTKDILFKMRIDAQNDKFKTTFSHIRITHLDTSGEIVEDPLSFKGDLDVVKAELMKFGDEILRTLKREKGTTG